MDYLGLAIGLLLPWLGGYLWLAILERRFSSAGANTIRQIGYGLFIGYAGLQGLVLACNKLLGGVTFMPVLGALVLVVGAGGVLFAKTRSLAGVGSSQSRISDDSKVERVLFWLCFGWAILHLLFVAIEMLHRPVFPWDAWLSWMYRAKAWFYSGQIFTMDHPTHWLHGSGDAKYNVIGDNYPTFVPVLALWAASTLGRWSETLVNLPVLFCGIALGLGMYGQTREFGTPRWAAALCAYLLLSLPLVGTHLSLAGKADIWMAGFTGLGFVALLSGLTMANPFQIILGLGMAAMGIATKLEGTVWFIAFLLTLALVSRLRITLVVLASAAIVSALAWALGFDHIDLPLLGSLGMVAGRVHIPLLGSYALQSFDLWDDYLDNFLASGTWHLMWTFVALGLVGLFLLPAGRVRKALVVFFLVLLTAQLFIFGVTEQGRWAEDWTAINRLPLHFAPALLFSIAMVASTLLSGFQRLSTDRPLWQVPAVAFALTLTGVIAYLLTFYPTGDGQVRTFSPRNMGIMVGEGSLVGHVRVIDGYQNNIALLSSGATSLDADRLKLLKVDTGGTNQRKADFFWRNTGEPEEFHKTEISGRGHRLISLSDNAGWQGRVIEIGLIFYNDEDRPVEFHTLELAPHSLPGHLTKLAHDWGETAFWTQKSVNWLPAGAVSTTVPLPDLLAVWVLLTAFIVIIFYGRKPVAYASIVMCAVVAWTLTDLRWSANRLAQAETTIDDYPLINATHLEFGDDIHTKQLVDAGTGLMNGPDDRLIIMAEDPEMQFQMLRAKYHALPIPAYVHEGRLNNVPVNLGNYVMVMRNLYVEPGHEPANSEAYTEIMARRAKGPATTMWDGPEGFILRIERDALNSD